MIIFDKNNDRDYKENKLKRIKKLNGTELGCQYNLMEIINQF